MTRAAVSLWAIIVVAFTSSFAADKIEWTAAEKPIADKIQHLYELPADKRPLVLRDLAVQILQLPPSDHRMELALDVAAKCDEGDSGHDTLQVVADALATVLKQQPQPDQNGQPAIPYLVLGQLVRYEGLTTTLDAAPFKAALARFAGDDISRDQADFALNDLQGKRWTLKSLKGKVVLVNFWATWCGPCRRELPEINRLAIRFKDQGLVVLTISDDEEPSLRDYVEQNGFTLTVLLDPGSKTQDAFHVYGIPKTFIYNREGKLVAQAIDQRTEKQFLSMLAKAGIE